MYGIIYTYKKCPILGGSERGAGDIKEVRFAMTLSSIQRKEEGDPRGGRDRKASFPHPATLGPSRRFCSQ